AVLTGPLRAQLIADDATLALARLELLDAPGSSFKRANLRMASFTSQARGPSRLVGASFVEADLFRANLSRTECRQGPLGIGCDFTRARLREANLRGILCAGATPYGPLCDFTEADFTGADLTG